MANDSIVKARKTRGGWIEVEEPLANPTPEIVATSSPSSPTLFLSWEILYKVFSETIGNCLWRQFGAGEVDLTADQRTTILERALDALPLSVQNVQALLVELRKPNPQGWTLASSYSALVSIAEDFLKQNGVTVEPPKLNAETQKILDALNNRSGVLS